MAQGNFTVEGRTFRTESDYARARRDKETIDRIRREINFGDKKQVEKLLADLKGGKYQFHTLLGQDFREEVEEVSRSLASGQKQSRTGRNGSGAGRNAADRSGTGGSAIGGRAAGKASAGRSTAAASIKHDAKLEAYIQEELEKREKRRKLSLRICGLVAVCCLGYFGVYSYYDYRTNSTYQELSDLKDKNSSTAASRPGEKQEESGPLYTLDDAPEAKEVLDEYKDLLNVNKKLIGWIKIADTYIDYPVMQTSDNEYYLNHNLNQEFDNNGSIFMDKDCDAMTPSTNLILYGHHMKSGKMFGKLHLYESKSYYEKHPYIQFDTIYEKGNYQVMYVFRSRVYNEDEIVFKYYQFIDASSEQEFDSYMKEMADMSFYDTGVKAEFGDELLTLSTCDYEEKNGRFVVVAKKIAKE